MEHVGFIGLGWMGSNFASRLLESGAKLQVFDLAAEKMEPLVKHGAVVAKSAREMVEKCELVLLSLPNSHVAVKVMEEDVWPAARKGQIVVDLGTTEIPETRRVAGRLAEKGCALLDCPVSGDPRMPVYMFAGGEREAFEKARGVLEKLADPQHLTWCGPSGAGQVMKGVNQLSMGLVQAAWLETISFATRQGIDAGLVAQAVGGPAGWRAELAGHAKRVAAGDGEKNDLKFAELPYFLKAAEAAGMDLPMTATLYGYCAPGPRNWRDNMNRAYTAYWYMLNRGRG